MRLRSTVLAAAVLAALVLVTSAAQAYVFTLVRQPIPGKPITGDPAGICVCLDDDPSPGDVVYFDLYLDTEGESDIVLFSMSLLFDPSIVSYRPDASDLADDVLYSPIIVDGGGKIPSRWMRPDADPPSLWSGSKPPGLEQLDVAFYERSLSPTVATATNEWLGRIAFEVVGPGYTEITPGWDQLGNAFTTGEGEWVDGPPIEVVWVPEPATALLVGLGIASLGVTRRRGRRTLGFAPSHPFEGTTRMQENCQ